jgi:hypothetical protein
LTLGLTRMRCGEALEFFKDFNFLLANAVGVVIIDR